MGGVLWGGGGGGGGGCGTGGGEGGGWGRAGGGKKGGKRRGDLCGLEIGRKLLFILFPKNFSLMGGFFTWD